MKIYSNTAILLFAQTANADSCSKKLQSNAVFEILNKKVLQTVQNSGLDYFHFTEQEQLGSSFGERFSNSIQEVYALGYTSVICLGNDTPLLTTGLIHKAANALHNGKTVAGKSTDGGLYLIGLHHADFNAQEFEQLPWQTSNLSAHFEKSLLSQNKELILLKALADIDSEKDLKQFLSGKDARYSIIRLLLMALSRKRDNNNHLSQPTITVQLSQTLNKGSPLAA